MATLYDNPDINRNIAFFHQHILPVLLQDANHYEINLEEKNDCLLITKVSLATKHIFIQFRFMKASEEEIKAVYQECVRFIPIHSNRSIEDISIQSNRPYTFCYLYTHEIVACMASLILLGIGAYNIYSEWND